MVAMDSERARIATVAAERFHACGITATGVAELSRAAGVSKRTLYQRFGSKDGLVTAAYESLDLPVYRSDGRYSPGARPRAPNRAHM